MAASAFPPIWLGDDQAEATAHYAELRGVEIVLTNSDKGKCGQRILGHDGVKQLIDDIHSGRADFEAVLVYGIGRWGQFQGAEVGAIASTPANAQASPPSTAPSSSKTMTARSPR